MSYGGHAVEVDGNSPFAVKDAMSCKLVLEGVPGGIIRLTMSLNKT
jgi:hypothetical protein